MKNIVKNNTKQLLLAKKSLTLPIKNVLSNEPKYK